MNRQCVIATILCIGSASSAPAQESAAVSELSADATDTHEAIRAVRDGVLKAMREKDADALVSYLHENVVLTAQAGTELKVFRKHDGVRGYLDQMLTGSNPGVRSLELNVEVDELTILHGQDAGVAFGSSNDHYVLSGGNEFDLATRWSATLVGENETWKIANLHVSSNLFDNPVLAAAVSANYVAASFAAVGGLLVGFVAGLFFMARRIDQ